MNFDEDFTVISPGCGCHRFAVPTTVYILWRRTHQWWHCPHCGRRRMYKGESDIERRLREAEERLNQERNRAAMAESKAAHIGRQYARMKHRVKNGVCPCCTRTFENLSRHMRDKHPDFGAEKNLKTLRLLYGLTQSKVAEEIGIPSPYVSAFETGKYVPDRAKQRIEEWLNREASLPPHRQESRA